MTSYLASRYQILRTGIAIDTPKYAILLAMNEAIDNEDNITPDNSATITKPRNIRSERMLAGQKRNQKTIKPTPRQKIAAKLMHENIANNLGMTKGEVLLKSGYDPSTAVNPQMVTETRGYKMELAKYGLTEELITSSLVEDIQAKPQKRVRELELGADILNMRKKQSIFGDVHFSLVSLAEEWEKTQRLKQNNKDVPSIGEGKQEAL